MLNISAIYRFKGIQLLSDVPRYNAIPDLLRLFYSQLPPNLAVNQVLLYLVTLGFTEHLSLLYLGFTVLFVVEHKNNI